MPKIKELLHIQSSYSTQVDLKREYNNAVLKHERMASYKPIKAHRDAFQIIAEGAYAKNSKRCFILSGSYGTGKSHLLLMAANYFGSQSDTKEMTQFFKNYSESEENESEKKAGNLKKVRKDGRYLVCICDYGANNLESYILRAIKDALKVEGISENEMDSYYLQAINKIEEWETSGDSYFYDRLGHELEVRNWTANRLKQELSEYNKEAIELFKEIHKKITTSDFEYDKDNYVQIIEQLANTKEIKNRFAGIVILFDEFDYQLKGKRFDLDEFQKFAQMCAASFMSNFPIIFIATTHRSFASYRSTYNAADFLTVSDRIKEIPLETQGIEEIISAVVNPQKRSSLWANQIRPRVSTFNKLSNECTALKIFDWLTAPKVRKMIIENIYSMHPMATYSLLKLASDVGSNNRSVFTFFADEKNDPGSYDWYVRSHDILNTSGELQFYTTDLLFDYFSDKINSDNQELRQTVREYIRNYEASLRELNKIRLTGNDIELQGELYERILKVIIIFQVIGTSISKGFLKFGLDINSPTREKELEYCLKNACSKKIIFFNETNQCYEFKRSDALDIAGMITEYKNNEDNVIIDIFSEIELLIKEDEVRRIKRFFKDEYYLEASRYNYHFKEDKRLIRKYCTVKELENTTFFANLLTELQEEKDYKKSYEGIALYVFCETDDDVKKAKLLAMNNTSDRIIIGVPLEENAIYDDVFSLKAAFHVDRTGFSQQDSAVLNERIVFYDTNLYNKLNQYIIEKNLVYYGQKGIELANASSDNDAAATKMLEMLYEDKRNKINHEDLNKVHTFKEANNFALRDAVEMLLDINSPISYRKDYGADRGDIRYIQNVLLQHGVIKQQHIIGNQVICIIEQDTTKYAKVLPALAEMIKEIESFDMFVMPHGLINDYMTTYGIGLNAAILFFAVTKRYYKDSIIVMQDAHEIGSLKLTTYDTLLDLLYHQKYKNAIMEYKKIQNHDEVLIRQLYGLFSASGSDVEVVVSIDQLYEKIRTWYKELHNISKVKSIYQDGVMDSFIDLFNNIDKVNARDFVLEELKTIIGYDRQDLILEDKVPELIDKFKKLKDLAEQGLFLVRSKLMEQMKDVFDAQDSTVKEINEAMSLWLGGLEDFQRSYANPLHIEESKILNNHLGMTSDIEELVMETLPNAFKLGVVKTWMADKCDSLIQKVKRGKNHIEHNLYLVVAPKYNVMGKDVIKTSLGDGQKTISYSGELKLEIILDTVHEKVYITSNGEDPKNPNSQREVCIEKFVFITREDKKIKFCGADNDGNYSLVVSLELANEDNKYVAKIVENEEQIKIGVSPHDDYQIQVILPKDQASLNKCIKSILNHMKSKHKINNADIQEVLSDLLSEIGE